MPILIEVLKQIAKSIMISLLTEKFIKEVIVYALEKLAQKTDNKVDDDLVAKVKEAMETPTQTK